MSYTITGRVVATKHAGTSTMGNPSYWVTLDTGDIFRTSANAGIAYGITNRNFRDEAHVFSLTKAGRISGAMSVARYLATTDGKDARARSIHNEGIGTA